jgi:hypothetical protein
MITLSATVTSRLPAETVIMQVSLFHAFTQRYLTFTGKTLERLGESHAAPAGRREVTVAFNSYR